MKPSSCKAKGRILQQQVRDKILANHPELEPDDVTSRSMGAGGEDILLSPKARSVFPFSLEVKNQEALNIWAALKQAEVNAGKCKPLVVFKRNRSETYCCLKFQDFLELLKKS